MLPSRPFLRSSDSPRTPLGGSTGLENVTFGEPRVKNVEFNEQTTPSVETGEILNDYSSEKRCCVVFLAPIFRFPPSPNYTVTLRRLFLLCAFPSSSPVPWSYSLLPPRGRPHASVFATRSQSGTAAVGSFAHMLQTRLID